MITRTLLPLSLVLAPTLWLAGPPAQGEAARKATQRSTKQFTIDGVHSSVVFRVQHVGASMFYGRFNRVAGSLKVDDAHLDKSFIKIEIPTDSVDANSSSRDRHLKSQDFFNVKEYPKITFESTKVEKDGDGYEVTGDLTLRGVTRSVTAKATHTGTANISRRFGLRTGYEAILEIKRSDFGMDFMTQGSFLGDDVRIYIAVEGALGGGRRGGRRRR